MENQRKEEINQYFRTKRFNFAQKLRIVSCAYMYIDQASGTGRRAATQWHKLQRIASANSISIINASVLIIIGKVKILVKNAIVYDIDSAIELIDQRQMDSMQSTAQLNESIQYADHTDQIGDSVDRQRQLIAYVDTLSRPYKVTVGQIQRSKLDLADYKLRNSEYAKLAWSTYQLYRSYPGRDSISMIDFIQGIRRI